MQEKRKHNRHPLNVEVTCTGFGDASFTALGVDISLGGMFLRSDQSPAFGTQLVVRVLLPGQATECELPCTVRWSTPTGFGVQFGLLGARETHAITKVTRAHS